MHDPATNSPAPDERAHVGMSTEARDGPSRRPRKGLPIRFVTRMSDDLSDAVAAAAREDGVTAGAFVRRILLDRVGMQSPEDARSGRPIRRTDEDVAAISTAIRHLATVSIAVSGNDKPAAQTGLQDARSILIPLAIRRPSR